MERFMYLGNGNGVYEVFDTWELKLVHLDSNAIGNSDLRRYFGVSNGRIHRTDGSTVSFMSKYEVGWDARTRSIIYDGDSIYFENDAGIIVDSYGDNVVNLGSLGSKLTCNSMYLKWMVMLDGSVYACNFSLPFPFDELVFVFDKTKVIGVCSEDRDIKAYVCTEEFMSLMAKMSIFSSFGWCQRPLCNVKEVQ